MPNPQLPAEPFHRALVAPTVQPHIRDQRPHGDLFEACLLKSGCHYEGFCQSVCWLSVRER